MAYLITFLGVITISMAAFAVSVTITTPDNAGYHGAYTLDGGFYSAPNTAHNVVEASQGATTQPLAWANCAAKGTLPWPVIGGSRSP